MSAQTQASSLSACLGHPRIGANRELKSALESFWAGQSSSVELREAGAALRRRHWQRMKGAGIDVIPSNDFSLYDHMVDMAVCVDAVPARYRAIADPLQRYFAMARGQQVQDGIDVPALEMTKWFDTNSFPELEAKQAFKLEPAKLLAELAEARALGIETRPVVIGPVTFLLLSKLVGGDRGATTLTLLDALLPVYERLFSMLRALDVAWVQLDEPCLVLDLEPAAKLAYERAFRHLSSFTSRPRVMLTTYFGDLGENLRLATGSGFEGLHVDLVRAPKQLGFVLASLPPAMTLSAGVVDGRNIWRADLDAAHDLVRTAARRLGVERVLVAPSCSLLHVPVHLSAERNLDAELRSWLAFAGEKLVEVRTVAQLAGTEVLPDCFGPRQTMEALAMTAEARTVLAQRGASARTRNLAVRARMAQVGESMLRRRSPFGVRARRQRARFDLPAFPTTTIGSFPQTREVRATRAAWRSGRTTAADYDAFLRAETRRCIARQEELGLDVLVHGEFERTDMVEYFGEQLSGFAFTESGWVQSYGSRCVKPPILFGDVARPRPMTVEWSRYAQSLTGKPVKGMLTGPVTILQWSFVRDDQPRAETCMQVALALRDEVQDLEAAGLAMIQVDEPAIREGLPLKRRDWKAYLRWAVDSFRLATAGVGDETQIHTHMCYAEFGDVLGAIAELDADVLSIETSRSRMELLQDFARFRYPNEIGPGVYDIHSPRVPSGDEMFELLERAASVVPADRLWVNPDCGLKTRGWSEVESALGAMVAAARRARERLVEACP